MRKLFGIILLSSAIFGTGCVVCGVAVVGATGAGIVSYVKGDLEVIESASVEEIEKAIDSAIVEMKMTDRKKDIKPKKGEVTAKSHFGDVTFQFANKGPGHSTLSIRVGTFGDEASSRYIYDKVKSGFGKAAKTGA